MRTPLLLLALSLTACSGSPPDTAAAPPAVSTDLPAKGEFVGRVWVSTMRGKPLGSMLVFLPNRTLLMDSCFETYRITGWGVAGNNIRWLEDSVPIEAAVSLPTEDELTLKIVGVEEPQTYIAASVPYVCPDMPK